MEDLSKKFNLIDIMGILLPGALVTFCLDQSNWFDFCTPVNAIFSNSVVALAACLCGLSFLMGCAIHTASKLIEKIFCKKGYFVSREVCVKYAQVFDNKLCPEEQKDKACANCECLVDGGQWLSEEKIHNIIRYVQRKGRPERLLMFKAYSAMSRSMIVALFIVIVTLLPFQCQDLPTYIICVAGIVVFCFRWNLYLKNYIEEVLILFQLEV